MPDDNKENIGLPEKVKIPRRYNMSDKALQQRRDAACQPKPGMKGKRNNWKHGMYATSFLTRIKPCLSTCDKYPCVLIEEGTTEPGGDCLDAEELLHIVRSVHSAIQDPANAEDFKEVSALIIANSIKVLEMLQEDIIRDGSLVKQTKETKYGTDVEYKPHPALLALPKMIQNLGMTPDQFMITPKAQAKLEDEEAGAKTIAQLLGSIGKKANKEGSE